MVTIIALISMATLFAALAGIIIHQKSLALRDLYDEEVALGGQVIAARPVTRRNGRSATVGIRNTATARRKLNHACGHQA
ncbi:hypothetical protein [Neorhizobium sp. NCHU2750]|uniref:hypothetical protein n=1 Tax=Neorhizobium sp. NCHU2750 TaxID=1825976 RepID=UPI000EB73137|nr:hypothetical protein NCHU2750_38620 [Neorhizobium sp. NCHU2750]